MGEGVRLYAGTQHGLFTYRGRGDRLEQIGQAFGDTIVDSMTGCRGAPERVYVGVIDDGLYRTLDAGQSWTRVLEGDIRSVTVDPTNEQVVYAGTEPVHLYRSEDGGEQWQELTSLLALPEEVRKKWWTPYPRGTGHIRNIFVHPLPPNTLYLCLEHGGVVRSLDRGETWEDVTQGIDYTDMHLLASLPDRTDRYYVSSARGFFTSADPAQGWVRAEEGMTRNYSHDFLILPFPGGDTSPTMLIAMADGSPGPWFSEVRGARSAMFRSDDCARSWYRVGRGLPDDLDAMIWSLTPDPTDPDTVFAGVGPVSRGQPRNFSPSPALSDGPGSVWHTPDRGESWLQLDLALPATRVLWAAAD
jgi:hypothetical protein